MNFFFFLLFNTALAASVGLAILCLANFLKIELDFQYLIFLLLGSLLFSTSVGLINLIFSKRWAIKNFGIRIIEKPINEAELFLLKKVEELSQKAGIKTPKVGVYEGPVNAFATGLSGKRGLIALSVYLFDIMTPGEIEGILAHEIAHLKFRDNLTATLLWGTLNALSFTFTRFLALIFLLRDKEFLVFLLKPIEWLLHSVAFLVAMFYSRWREYRADAYAAKLGKAYELYGALKKFQTIERKYTSLPRGMRAFGIVGFFGNLLSTHPPLDKRLKRIERLMGRL